MKKEYWITIAPIFTAVCLYILFAVCYGFAPINYPDNVKACYIGLTIALSGITFVVCINALIDPAHKSSDVDIFSIAKLEKDLEDIQSRIKKEKKRFE